jgi:hypothetical protein
MVTASLTYSIDYKGASPYRGGNELYSGAHYPHEMVVTIGGTKLKNYDLNKSLFEPYLNVPIVTDSSGNPHRQNDEILFCPGPLHDVRYPGVPNTGDYTYHHITYQYFVMARADSAYWLYERNGVDYQPDLTRMSDVPSGRFPMWACMTLSSDPTGTLWLAHDAPYTNEAPTGMNACFFDGSAGWSPMSECSPYYQLGPASQQWYWPTPR